MMQRGEIVLAADPEVVARWVAGWALSRGAPAPALAFGGLRVDVGLPNQKARYVFPRVSPGVREAAQAITEPHVFLKVCAPPEAVQEYLTDSWNIKPVSFMMTVRALDGETQPLGSRWQTIRESGLDGGAVNIVTDDGHLAARGRVFVVGSTAVFDQIETQPNHRRQGLGRAVMGELTSFARELGAFDGALVATPDGRALYQALGWELHSLYTTAVRD